MQPICHARMCLLEWVGWFQDFELEGRLTMHAMDPLQGKADQI